MPPSRSSRRPARAEATPAPRELAVSAELSAPVSPGVELCYQTFGDPADEPLLLVMGLGGPMTWWDPELLPQIARAGRERLLAFHVCDWLVPTKDILNDRGMMGDGVIDIRALRAAVEAQGFAGYSEIEIFSNDWWDKPIDEVLQTCIARHRSVV